MAARRHAVIRLRFAPGRSPRSCWSTVAALLIGATAKMMGDTVAHRDRQLRSDRAARRAASVGERPRLFSAPLHATRSATGTRQRDDHAHHGHHRRPRTRKRTRTRTRTRTMITNAAMSTRDHHGHADDDGGEPDVLPWGHAHGPEPEELAGAGGWRRGPFGHRRRRPSPLFRGHHRAGVLASPGIFGPASSRPSSWASAPRSRWRRSPPLPSARGPRRNGSRPPFPATARSPLRGIEVAAALLIMTFGTLLLAGYMVSEHMGMF